MPLLIGIICCGAFVHRQLHMDTPFGVTHSESKRFPIAVVASMLLYVYLMALSVLFPIYIQSINGHSATISGLVMIPGGIAMALVNPLAGKLYDKIGIKKLYVYGSLLMIISSLGMVFMKVGTHLMVFTVLNVIRNISTGCMMMPFVTWGMSGLHDKDTAHGTAILTSLRTIAGAFGAAIFMSIVSSVGAISSPITGMSVTFMGLTLVGVIELILAGYVVWKKV